MGTRHSTGIVERAGDALQPARSRPCPERNVGFADMRRARLTMLSNALSSGYIVQQGCAGSAQYVLDHMPDVVQMVYSDIGDEVYHGGRLIRRAEGCAAGRLRANPCREAYRLHPWGINFMGRQSWDPLVVLAAVRGPEAVNTSEVDIGWRNSANAVGANFWKAPQSTADEARQSQLALVGNASDSWRIARADAGRTLDDLLCAVPAWHQ